MTNDPFAFSAAYNEAIKTKEVTKMIGAILGDKIGAPYEFDRGGKTKSFSLL